MTTENESSKIHIDSDWKAEAQAEKEKLAEKAKQSGAEGKTAAGASGRFPPASMEVLISSLATPALLAMGLIPDPQTGQRYQSLEMARHHIDLLALIEEKTRGNVTDEEKKLITQTLFELRQAYIKIAGASRGPGA